MTCCLSIQNQSIYFQCYFFVWIFFFNFVPSQINLKQLDANLTIKAHNKKKKKLKVESEKIKNNTAKVHSI
jgi:hypothetical protein